MALGCLPFFRKAARTAQKEDDDRFDPYAEIELPSRSLSTLSSGFNTTISRKDSGLTSVSNSTVSSMRCVSVSFNPTVDEVVFDKNDAPSSVRKSSLDGCKARIKRSNTSILLVHATSGNVIQKSQNLVTLSSPQKLVHHQSPHSSLNYPPAPPSINILPSRSRSDPSHASPHHRTERRHLVSKVH